MEPKSAKVAAGKRNAANREMVTRANGDRTKEKLLNAAEALFGQGSFDTVSLRDITNAAGVTLALSSYHFTTKENLFAEVVARRAQVLNQMRREGLAQVLRGELTLEALLDAFMRPLFLQMDSEDAGWQAYVLVIAKLGQTNQWLDLLRAYFDQTAHIFLAQLTRLFPEGDEEELARCFSFALQLMLVAVSNNQRLDSLSGGRFHASDLARAYPVLLKFVVGGMKAALSLQAPAPRAQQSAVSKPGSRRQA